MYIENKTNNKRKEYDFFSLSSKPKKPPTINLLGLYIIILNY